MRTVGASNSSFSGIEESFRVVLFLSEVNKILYGPLACRENCQLRYKSNQLIFFLRLSLHILVIMHFKTPHIFSNESKKSATFV